MLVSGHTIVKLRFGLPEGEGIMVEFDEQSSTVKEK